MEKIFQESFQDEISVKKARLLINVKFRMGKHNLNSLLNEMKRLGLIKYKDKRTLLVLWKPKD